MAETQERRCAGCGGAMEGRNAASLFCARSCKTAHHNLQMRRGAEIMDYLQTWRAGKNARTQQAKALASYAFSEACVLLDEYNREDRAAGRSSPALVAPRFERGQRLADGRKRWNRQRLMATADQRRRELGLPPGI